MINYKASRIEHGTLKPQIKTKSIEPFIKIAFKFYFYPRELHSVKRIIPYERLHGLAFDCYYLLKEKWQTVSI